MTRLIFGFAMSLFSMGCIGSAAAASPDDVAQVRAVAMRQADAWNRHDAKAYADLFAADADVVNVVGWWWQGRAELERKLTTAYARMFKDSKLTITDVQVRFPTPSIAVAHARWTMTGAKPPPGLPEPKEGIQTLVLQKHAGKWLIDVFQNTNALPEIAFPAKGAGAGPGSG
ncbi:MAG TPA: SgcJ/EcaC family oxidoreductase [Rhodanobacteraceae bacterium]|nr:SgcJ/EcaC family oxidoreductase [Rhodanobacteraceae bacterium]